MLNNPGKTMAIYDIPGILNKAFPLASTPSNITAGFKKAVIVPFDREGFHATADYNPGFVTDRADPENVAVLLEMDLPPEKQPFDVPPYFFVDVELTVEPIAEPTVLEQTVEQTVEPNVKLNEETTVEPTVEANSPKKRSGSDPKANNSPTPSSISSASSSSTASIIEELRPFPKVDLTQLQKQIMVEGREHLLYLRTLKSKM
jgi:hypothetical protein